MAGRFTASGGNITAGARDSVQDGNPATNVSFTGTFTQTPNGRTVLNLTTAANSNLVVWMVSPTRGLFLVNDPNTVQDGSLDLQQLSSFSNSTMNGQFGFVMDGFDVQYGERPGRHAAVGWIRKADPERIHERRRVPKLCRSIGKLFGFRERADRGLDQHSFQQPDFLPGLGQ